MAQKHGAEQCSQHYLHARRRLYPQEGAVGSALRLLLPHKELFPHFPTNFPLTSPKILRGFSSPSKGNSHASDHHATWMLQAPARVFCVPTRHEDLLPGLTPGHPRQSWAGTPGRVSAAAQGPPGAQGTTVGHPVRLLPPSLRPCCPCKPHLQQDRPPPGPPSRPQLVLLGISFHTPLPNLPQGQLQTRGQKPGDCPG